METVTINPGMYERASTYAKQHNISLSDLVEKGLLAVIRYTDEPYQLRAESELSPLVRSLVGVARGGEATDFDGREARVEHIERKDEADLR